MLSPGTRLGRYEILFPLASGGMATVYAGRAVGEGRFRKPVALKVPLPELAKETKFVEMLMDEANLSSCINSPHVVQTLDLARDGLNVFLAMELVVGVSLRALAKGQSRAGEATAVEPFPVRVGLAILSQAARGLHDAHEARGPKGETLSLVHRDVSPHNLLVGIDGRVRVADFGIAHAAHRLTRTMTGELKGKLAYFAPEQLVGEQIDRRVDVFALGVVAYELFTGVRPFDGDNPLAIALNVAQKVVEPARSLRADLPAEISEVIATAMMRDKNRRFASCAALADALDRAAAGSGGLARPEEIGQLVRARQSVKIARMENALALAAAGDDLAEIADELVKGLESSDREQGLLEGSVPTIATYESAPARIAVAPSVPPPPPKPAADSAHPPPRAPETELVMEGSAGNIQLDLASVGPDPRALAPRALGAQATPAPGSPATEPARERVRAYSDMQRAVYGSGSWWILLLVAATVGAAWLGVFRAFLIVVLALMVVATIAFVIRLRSP